MLTSIVMLLSTVDAALSYPPLWLCNLLSIEFRP